MTVLDQLDVFHGDTTESLSVVYARLTGIDDMTGLSLTGYVRGPYCENSRTLTTTIAFEDLGPGSSLLARAKVPDPCFWSPDVPAMYQVCVELRHNEKVVESVERQFGIRVLGIRGRSFHFNEKRWVVRGIAHGEVCANHWQGASAAMVVTHPDNELCDECSRRGVFLIALVGGDEEFVKSELRRLSRWAAVGIVVIMHDENLDFDPRDVAPTILLGQSFAPGQAAKPAPWCRIVVGEVGAAEQFAQQFRECELPVIAVQHNDEDLAVSEARGECDRLQRDLAPYGDFAGYVVMLREAEL